MAFRFLQSLFKAPASPADSYDDTLIERATERVVDGTDPRLRAVSHYQRLLRAAVGQAVGHVIQLVDSLPAATDVSRRRFTLDPLVRALFVSPQHIQEVMSFGRDMQDYLQQVAPPEMLYGAVGMVRREKSVFGMALEGDRVIKDIAQVSVSFSNHVFRFPAASEAETRWELKKRAFDHLIEMALQHLVSVLSRREQLEQQRILLQVKAKALKAGQLGLESLLETPEPAANDVTQLEQQITAVETELMQIRTDTATLQDHLEIVATVLSEPEKYLHGERLSLTLDHTNIRVAEGSDRPANTLTLDEISLGDQRQVVVLLVQFPSSELIAKPDAFEEASRYL